MKRRRLLARLLGATDPDPMASMPKVDPVATREDDGTITFTATVPKLDPKSLEIEHNGENTFIVRGIMWVRPRRWQRLSQDVVFEIQLAEARNGKVTTSYDGLTLTIRVLPREHMGSGNELA